jgi:hypothetical protein
LLARLCIVLIALKTVMKLFVMGLQTKIQRFRVAYQFYVIPTIKVTYDKWLHGYRDIQFIWGRCGIEIRISKRLDSDD